MPQVIDFKVTLFLDLADRAEDDAAYSTIDTFVTAQGGTFRWGTKQASGGDVGVRADLFLPVADRSEVHAKCNLIENNLSALPRDGVCVRTTEIVMVQKGLPDSE